MRGIVKKKIARRQYYTCKILKKCTLWKISLRKISRPHNEWRDSLNKCNRSKNETKVKTFWFEPYSFYSFLFSVFLRGSNEIFLVKTFCIFVKTIVTLCKDLKKKIKIALNPSYPCSCCFLVRTLADCSCLVGTLGEWSDYWLAVSILTLVEAIGPGTEVDLNLTAFTVFCSLITSLEDTYYRGSWFEPCNFPVYYSLNYLLWRHALLWTEVKSKKNGSRNYISNNW